MYFVADTYKNWTRIGEPFYNSKGKLSTKVKTVCPRCGGQGIIVSRVENGQLIPIPVDGGVCYQCAGAKYVEKEIRLYTESEYNTMQKNKERERNKKEAAAEAKRLAEFDEKKAAWLKNNKFGAEGYTYIYVGNDSYQRKEELKEKGYRFNPILLWHCSEAEGEEKVERHHVDEFYQLTAWGEYSPKEGAKDKVQSIIEAANPATSEWLEGTEGERIKSIPVTLVGIRGFETQYGYSQCVTFEDENKNRIVWFTAVNIPFEVGEECKLTGTIKKFDEYKGVKNTVMTRCKLA
jgi:hypothetical protein